MRCHIGLISKINIGNDTELYKRNCINISFTEWMKKTNIKLGNNRTGKYRHLATFRKSCQYCGVGSQQLLEM